MATQSSQIHVEMPLKALIYRSRATIEITPLILTAIVDESMYNNRRDQITGMLLFDYDRFVQYIEGSPRAVSKCYRRICQDTRHEEVEVLLERDIQQRAAPQWDMKLLHELPSQSVRVGQHDLVNFFRAAA